MREPGEHDHEHEHEYERTETGVQMRSSGDASSCSRRPERSASPTVERALIRQVKDEEDAHCAAVVGRRDGAEALLSCRVPLQSMAAHTELVPSWRGRGPCIDSTHNLELDLLAVEIYRADLEVDADGAG